MGNNNGPNQILRSRISWVWRSWYAAMTNHFKRLAKTVLGLAVLLAACAPLQQKSQNDARLTTFERHTDDLRKRLRIPGMTAADAARIGALVKKAVR
jgi:hypothetical protein